MQRAVGDVGRDQIAWRYSVFCAWRATLYMAA